MCQEGHPMYNNCQIFLLCSLTGATPEKGEQKKESNDLPKIWNSYINTCKTNKLFMVLLWDFIVLLESFDDSWDIMQNAGSQQTMFTT